jgi:hypothetical protein
MRRRRCACASRAQLLARVLGAQRAQAVDGLALVGHAQELVHALWFIKSGSMDLLIAQPYFFRRRHGVLVLEFLERIH